MKEKQINLYQGHICIKNVDGRLSFVNDSCIQKIKERIELFIKENPKIFRTKDIIFSVLKSYFKINKIFLPPNANNVIPINDPLYQELSHYIRKNPIYTERIRHENQLHKERKALADKSKSKESPIINYQKVKVERLKKMVK